MPNRVLIFWVALGLTAQTIPLTVTVVDPTTGKPWPDVEVEVINRKLETIAGPQKTNKQGSVQFAMEPGGYALRAECPSFGVTFYGQSPEGTAEVIDITAHDREKSISFPIANPATLTGFLSDEQGDPVEGISIVLRHSAWNQNRQKLTDVAKTLTDDRGFYRFTGIPPGAYQLCTDLTDTKARLAPVIGLIDLNAPPPSRVYAPACYPEAFAKRVTLNPGQSAAADLAIRPLPTAAISGTVSGVDFVGNLRLYPADPDSLWPNYSTFTSPKTPFVFPDVLAGKYVIEGSGTRKTELGINEQVYVTTPVELNGSNLDGIALRFSPPAQIHVAFEESRPGLLKKLSGFNLHKIGRDDQLLDGTQSQATRRFDLREGWYWVEHYTDEGCITEMKLNDQDVLRQSFHVAPGTNASMKVKLSSDCATISGTVMSEGNPVAGASVAILLSGTPAAPAFCYLTRTNPDGHFDIDGIAPGKYLLWAWNERLDGTMAGPESLASVESQALLVNAPAGKTRADIALLRGGTNK